MSTVKRIQGDYEIRTTDSSGTVANEVTITSASLNITGDLVVSGTTTTVNSTDLDVQDKTIVLNKGETGSGVTSPVHSGLEIDRGTLANVGIRYDDSLDAWQLTNDGSQWEYVLTGSSGTNALQNVVEDLSPVLGGDLDVNGFKIASTSNGDIVLDAHGTGMVKVEQEVTLKELPSDPSSAIGYNKIYTKAAASNGTGVFYVNNAGSGEFISKSQAIAYSLIL